MSSPARYRAALGLQRLLDGHRRLSDMNNWCSNGPRDGERCCALETIRAVSVLRTPYGYPFYFGFDAAYPYLKAAFQQEHGEPNPGDPASIALLNDGQGRFLGVAPEKRYRMILELYVRAIERAKKDLQTLR